MPRNRFFLRIYVGPSPLSARPVVATEDREVVRAAVHALVARLADPLPVVTAPEQAEVEHGRVQKPVRSPGRSSPIE